jgi:hypothetical protein
MEESTVEDVLRAGLVWLYSTEQPGDALIQHHGVDAGAVGNRRYKFMPRGSDRLPVVVVNVAATVRNERTSDLQNPLGERELDDLADVVTRVGAEFGAVATQTWNGHPAHTGSVQLGTPAHPSLLAAVDRYHRGCPEHRPSSVFCGCGWYQAGHGRMVLPDLRTEAP